MGEKILEGTIEGYANNRGEIPVLSLDSTIESIFYQMCIESPLRRHILLEWANSKKYIAHIQI